MPERPLLEFFRRLLFGRPRASQGLLRSLGLVALAGASCVKAPLGDMVPKREVAKAEAVHLLLVATNDWHGQLFATKDFGVQEALPQGGALTFFAQLSALREAFPESVLWADAGDSVYEGWAAHQVDGQLATDIFSWMGLDFATVGKHDFDYGAGREGKEAQGALKANMSRAKFPWSSANIYSTEDGRRPAWLKGDTLHMVERQGVHIGFVGLTTPTAPLYSSAANLEGLYVGNMALAAREKALALREKGADVVVLVAHAGAGECTPMEEAGEAELTQCEVQHSEIGQLLEALPEGLVDAVVAGHGHSPLGYFFKGVPVVQTQGLGKRFSVIELYWHPTQKRLLHEKTRIEAGVPICEKVWPSRKHCEGPPLPGEEAVAATFFGKKLGGDARLMALLAPEAGRFYEREQTRLGVEVGERLSLGEEEESALGGMWAESLLLATQADVALVHRGAFREELEAGALLLGRFFRSMPYNHRVALVRFSGEELRRLMQLAFGQTRFRFDVAGVELQLSCFPSGRRLVHTQRVSAEGHKHAVQDGAFYWVAMPEFLAQGGAGLEGMLVDAPLRPTKLKEGMRTEALRFWRQRPQALFSPLRPRILWENAVDSSCRRHTPHPKEQL